MKKYRLIVTLVVCVLLVFSGCSNKSAPNNTNSSSAQVNAAYEDSAEVTNFVKITMDDGKSFIIELKPQIAPITVKNFQDLVAKGFYDHLTFHRIEKGFVIQGGDPLGTGTGGPGYYIKGEFALNGIENTLSHKKGVVSMARSQSYDSAGSQFFVCLEDATALDGQYAAFAEVVQGMDQIEAIVSEVLAKTRQSNPTMEKVGFVKAKS